MTEKSYWKALDTRLTRRRGLVGLGAGTAAVAFLAACGSDGGAKTSSSNLYVPVDTTKQAKAGGVFKGFDRAAVGADHLDALLDSAGRVARAGEFLYSRLLKLTPGLMEEPLGEVEGDLAENFEVSPDGLQITMKLRGNAKWDRRAPTNSRQVDAEDVVFSWKKFSTLHNQRSNLVNSVNPNASIASVTATDKSTVVVKLAQKDSGILADLAHYLYYIQPLEAESKFDPKQVARGSAAWYADDGFDPGLGRKYFANPNWYVSGRPFIKEWEEPIIPEYATRLAQLKAGAIWAGGLYAVDVLPEDILITKSDVPKLAMAQSPAWPVPYWAWQFSWLDKSIFGDDRVRKAASMALDRDLILRTFSNSDQYEKAGFEVDLRWNSHIPAAYSGWWLDPQGKELGAGAEFFKYKPEESKKLLAAAGFPTGVEIPATTSNHSTYQSGMNEMLTHLDMMNTVGLRTQLQVVDNNSVYQGKYQNAAGQYAGITPIAQVNDPAGSRGSFLGIYLLPGGGRYHGFRATSSAPGDPKVTTMVNQIRSEFDVEKQAVVAKELQKHLAGQMYYVPWPGVAREMQLFWPVIGNFNVYRPAGRGAPQTVYSNWWIDETKAPLAKT